MTVDEESTVGGESVAAKPRRVGLKDIADELGISQTAVSFAINDRPGVSEETKRRVKEAAAKLGWVPVYAAQALGSSKTMTVGFAPARSADGIRDESFMLHFMSGLHSSLSRKRYGLLYQPCTSLKEETSVYKDWARRKRVDGVVLVDLREDDPRPELLRRIGIPAVLAGGPDPTGALPSLSIDDSGTMEMVLKHLLECGHRRIAYLSGNAALGYSRERVASFRRFAASRRLSSSQVAFTEFDPQTAARLTLEMAGADEPPTAFIYESETLALASMRAVGEWLARDVDADGGLLRYPYNLPAVVSFEDSFLCEMSYPSITSVHRDASEYGAKVAKLLLKVLAGERVAGDRKILTPGLAVRDSTVMPV